MNSWAQVRARQAWAILFMAMVRPEDLWPKRWAQKKAEEIKQQLALQMVMRYFLPARLHLKRQAFAGKARVRIGREQNLIDENLFKFCWIVDFPMYELDEKTGKIEFSHNPFSMPQGGMDALNNQDPLTIKAWQYDLVCNGVELSSGAIRNHLPEVMYRAFEIAGYGAEVVDEQFSGMISAFKFGARRMAVSHQVSTEW